MAESGTTNVEDLSAQLRRIRNQDILYRQMEERQEALVEQNVGLRIQLEKIELALEAVGRAVEEAHEWALAFALALSKVRTALSFPVDMVNRALLFTEDLEWDEKLNCGQIIRFLLDHGRKMEKTWVKMLYLVNHLPVGT